MNSEVVYQSLLVLVQGMAGTLFTMVVLMAVCRLLRLYKAEEQGDGEAGS